jgi:NAD(P)-dependent dehydrogenase (short-subunit alcohol dehydrogenase family)
MRHSDAAHKETIMGRLDGKVALISGGARGQGATEVHLFVREGAKVIFGDVLDEEGRQVEAAVRAAGGEATYVHLNVTSESDWRRAVETAVQHSLRQAERAGEQRGHSYSQEHRRHH